VNNTTIEQADREAKKREAKRNPFASEMSMRDYFAAKAMQGLLAGITPTTVWSHDEVAETAYNVADAMLRAREAT
jgi:hypothetical protein